MAFHISKLSDLVSNPGHFLGKINEMRSILLPVDKQVLINNISAYDHTKKCHDA
jgi:hypothetical protein